MTIPPASPHIRRQARRRGYRFLWTALLTLPMMAVIQDMCASIGLVTGHGLAGALRLRFPRPVVLAAVALLFVANIFNVRSNIAAISDWSRCRSSRPIVSSAGSSSG